MKELDKNTVDKTKALLGISEEIPINELYDKLYNYRNSQHPDKFQDSDAKTKAEQNFKEANSLLELLKKELELQLVSKNPSEILSYQKIYEDIILKQNIVDLQKEIKELKFKIEEKSSENLDLKKELMALRIEKLNEKKDELIQHYAPSKSGIFSNGIIFILVLITTILTKVEEIAVFISKYSPIPEYIFNYLLFSILIFIPLRFGYKYLKQEIISNIAQLIITPPMIQLFLQQLKNNEKVDNFSEINIYHFIERMRYPGNPIIRFLYVYAFGVNSHIIVNSLKDIFIYHLLSKQLIEISRADRLDRNFRIIKGYYHISFDDDELPF